MYLENKIIELLDKDSLDKAKNEYLDVVDNTSKRYMFGYIYNFYVSTRYEYYYHSLSMKTDGKNLTAFNCSYSDFFRKKKCKHIAKVLLEYNELFLPEPVSPLKITENFLNEYINNKEEKNYIKEPIKFLI